MMTKTRVWMGGVVVLALVAIALPSLVTAQYRGGGNQGSSPAKPAPQDLRFGSGPAWIEALELSEEQTEQLAALRLDFQQEQLRTRGSIAAAQAELDALLLDPEVTRSAVQSAGSALQELRDQAQSQRLNHQMDVREILTPEQREQWVLMKARRGGGGAFGLHRGRGPHAALHGSDCGDGWGPRQGKAMHRMHRMYGLHQGRGMAPEGPGPDETPEADEL